jgi:hypothetical protein
MVFTDKASISIILTDAQFMWQNICINEIKNSFFNERKDYKLTILQTKSRKEKDIFFI